MDAVREVRWDPELIARYGSRGPRYTSYPTAVQFHEGFAEADYRRNASASNEMPIPDPLSVYVHIPFCRSLCYYCACTKFITRNEARAEVYLRHVFNEIAMQSRLFDADRQVEQLHLGGGSPTYLSSAQLRSLMRCLSNHFSLRADGEQEFAIEVDPRTVGAEDIAALADMGFNRMSYGVQDFNPKVQEAVNRIQSEEQTVSLIEAARASGFHSVSLDLIYGLPFQSESSFDHTLDQVLAARPDRLAVYNYAHLPQMFKAQKLIRAEDLPTPEEKLDILRHTIEKLTAASYVYIGMDHFALPEDDLVGCQQRGELQRNFQGYSTHARCDLIGLGVSSISNVWRCYSQNVKNIKRYCELIDAGHLPVERGVQLDDDDILRADVIEQLMCHGKLVFASMEEGYTISFKQYFADEMNALEQLEADGLVEVDEDGIEVTPAGRLLLRPVAMVFDRYLRGDTGGERFSKVI